MSLREEMWKYEQITGESAEHVPLMKLGAFLDGYEMGIEAKTDVLDKIRAEIASYGAIWVEYTIPGNTHRDIENIVENVLKQAKEQVLDIIDKYKAESEE